MPQQCVCEYGPEISKPCPVYGQKQMPVLLCNQGVYGWSSADTRQVLSEPLFCPRERGETAPESLERAKPGATPDMLAGLVPYKRPKPTAKPTPKMLSQRERFTELQHAASEILNAPTLRKYFEKQYKEAKPKCTLRNFVMKNIAKM